MITEILHNPAENRNRQDCNCSDSVHGAAYGEGMVNFFQINVIKAFETK